MNSDDSGSFSKKINQLASQITTYLNHILKKVWTQKHHFSFLSNIQHNCEYVIGILVGPHKAKL